MKTLGLLICCLTLSACSTPGFTVDKESGCRRPDWVQTPLISKKLRDEYYECRRNYLGSLPPPKPKVVTKTVCRQEIFSPNYVCETTTEER